MQDKTPSFIHGISFQLAKIGIILAFVLSFVMSFIQTSFDYIEEQKNLNKFIDRVIAVAKPPAARSVATLDED
ncbi:MAG TPA: hypothetical protein PK002_03205, partial [Cellvibrio sp.]|nr:hypothetical protein [Cellvibrio sp.]